ncbi:MAG: MarR family transcriptional regulator [Erysipelotrichaceae bacterium]|nr:MarR family transcriptional regulator [Erysipelotrichaceae bacterium]MDY5252958.1 MarR family transcriptional regulator [Erysipelotrichaceae bacterium]
MDNKSILLAYIDLNLEKISKEFALEFKTIYNISHLQMSAIWYLGKHQSLTMGELAAKLRISKQQATKLADTLENKGLIVREQSKENKRKINVRLSLFGNEVLVKVEEQYTNEFIANITNEEDLTCLFASMENIVRILGNH